MATSYAYDDARRLLSMDHVLAGVSFQRFDYVLDSVGNRTSRTEANAGAAAALDAYQHDAIDQVTQVKYGNDPVAGTQARQTDFAYDQVGNRTTMTEDTDGSGATVSVATPYTANNVNQYTTIDGLAVPQYDANGNTTLLQTKRGDPAWNYTYDAQNRLTGGSNGTTSFSFAYDPLNRCIARTITPLNTQHSTLNPQHSTSSTTAGA